MTNSRRDITVNELDQKKNVVKVNNGLNIDST